MPALTLQTPTGEREAEEGRVQKKMGKTQELLARNLQARAGTPASALAGKEPLSRRPG